MSLSSEVNSAKEYATRDKSPIIFNNIEPQELLKRLELLDGSLAAGNNGVLPEYIQIAHRLRDIEIVSNTQLNELTKKACRHVKYRGTDGFPYNPLPWLSCI